MEENYVDIKLFLPDRIRFFEVKPYDLVEDCVINSLGQLLKYYYFDTNPLPKELCVIGPNKPTSEEEEFIDFVKKNLKIKFDYENFNLN